MPKPLACPNLPELLEVFPHLGAKALEVINTPNQNRIDFIREPHWIGYQIAIDTMKRWQSLITRPVVHRMPCDLLLGSTNNGKTALLLRLVAKNPPREREDGDGTIVPVLYVQAPPVPVESRFYESILKSLGATYKASDRAARLQGQATALMARAGVRVLLVDEVQHVVAGDTAHHRQHLNLLKFLTNELQISIVAAGPRATYNYFAADPQMINRFTPVCLPRWRMDDGFRSLLDSFENLIPLKNPSGLGASPLAEKIMAMTEGRIGEVASLLFKAGEQAILKEQERIDEKLLDSLGWQAPKDRVKLPDELD